MIYKVNPKKNTIACFNPELNLKTNLLFNRHFPLNKVCNIFVGSKREKTFKIELYFI